MTEPLLFDLPGDADGDGPPPEPMYGSLEGWVVGQFVPMFRRPLGGEFRWCRQWWRHAEAIVRLTALWHSWEALRLEPGTGMASWLRDHLDHQLPVLMSRSGPFARCSEDEHFEPHQAATDLAPPGWWLPSPGGFDLDEPFDDDDEDEIGGVLPTGAAFGGTSSDAAFDVSASSEDGRDVGEPQQGEDGRDVGEPQQGEDGGGGESPWQ